MGVHCVCALIVQGLAKFGYDVSSGKLEVTSYGLDSRQLFASAEALDAVAVVALKKISMVCHLAYRLCVAALPRQAADCVVFR